MSRHPVTPMHEADLRQHLAQQTALLRVHSIDLPSIQCGLLEQELASRLAAGADAVLFDGVERHDVEETGRLLWQFARQQPLFAVGSSGLTYGLAAAWQTVKMLPEAPRVLHAL